jgi:vacuolar-type H+-ATPase subunit H/uncharacterized protein YndB with AHSA1/START domain
MSESIEVSRVIPARPERIFNAWLSGDEHGLMIGSTATYNDATGEFTAWDGYISGRTIEKKTGARFVQSWRTTEFPDGAADSKLEVRLAEDAGGTRVTLLHTDIPDGQGESYEVGWSDHYFDPMTDYFTSARSRLKDAGEAITEAAETAQDALSDAAEEAGEKLEAAGKEVKKAAKKVQKQAKQAGKKVQKLVATAQKKLAAAGRKAKAKVQARSAKKGKSRKPAKKKPSRAGAKKRR